MAAGRGVLSLEHILAHYGLPALFLGAGLEGETVVVAGGLLAHARIVPLAGAMIAASTGSFVADQIFFLVGRRARDSRMADWARSKAVYARALAMFEAHPLGFIFAFRFIYGFRTVSPFAIGTSRVHWRTFLIANACAAAIWGSVFTLVGYFFGRAFERVLHQLRPSRTTLIVGGVVVIVLFAGYHLVRWWRERRART